MTLIVAPAPYIAPQSFNRDGEPNAFGQIFTYAAGTTTPQLTYQDPTGGSQNQNPIVLDASGNYNMYLDTTLVYRIVTKDVNGVVLSDIDDVQATPATGGLVSSIIAGTGIAATGTGAVTVSNTGVLSVTGSSGRITVSSSTGAATLDISASYAGQASIATVGTVTAGTWNATTIAIAHGGTGQVSANAALNALLPSQTGQNGKVLTSDGTSTTWTAIAGSGSLTANGYYILPGGLYLQWGSFTSAVTDTTINFPIAFPTQCFNVTSSQPGNVSYGYVMRVKSFTVGTCTFENNSSPGQTVYWHAIGK